MTPGNPSKEHPMTLAPSPYDHADLRPALGSKGLKTFHLADEDGAPACGVELDSRAYSTTQRHALRRGLTPCPKCAQIEATEIAAEALEELEAAGE
jgi:hypothetical protein